MVTIAVADKDVHVGAPPSGTPDRQVRRDLGVRASQTLLSASLLGFLLHWRYGYGAGKVDHWILSPQGINWADPTKFSNDWILENAPQPHWFFDVVTWFGATIDQLGAVYFLYWAISLVVFGAATVLLAHKWAPAHPWVATVMVTMLGGITPWWLLGTGSPMLAIALPGVLAGFLIYLILAALLTGNYRMAGIVAVVTAIVHVQQGGVAAVLLFAVAVVHFVRNRRIDWWLAGSAVACLGIMFAALKARPVAGNVNDFAQACQKLIPYHCEATSWPSLVLWQGIAMVGLALLSVLYMTRQSWPVWAATLGLSAFGLLVGVTVDRWDVPTLGVLAQGLNIYRLDVLLMPFAVWGVLLPIFGRFKEWQRWALLGVVLFLGFHVVGMQFYESAYPLERPNGGPWMAVFAFALTVACAWASRTKAAVRVAATVMALSITLSITDSPSITLKALDATFIQDDDLREWGEAVQRVVPPGQQLIAPPLAMHMRLATARGVLADCKGGPYGGPAWQDYQDRIEDLGGFDQCLDVRPEVYQKLSADRVEMIARKYGTRFVVFEGDDNTAVAGLRRLGWREVLGPHRSVNNRVYQAPWSA